MVGGTAGGLMAVVPWPHGAVVMQVMATSISG